MVDPTSRTERIIAGARLVLAIAAIGLMAATPAQVSQNPNEAYSVVALYLLYSIAVIWIIDRGLMRIDRIALFSQLADTFWFPVILLYTQGEHSPFFLYYVYSLITASFRWGFKETLLFNTANVGMYVIVHFATAGPQSGFQRFWLGPTYLYVLACLIGYLGEHQKRVQRQLMSLAEMPRSIVSRKRFSRMLEATMINLRQVFRAGQCILVFYDVEAGQFFVRKTGAGVQRKSYQFGGLSSADTEFLCAPRSNVGYLVNPHKKLARVFGLRAVMAYDFDQQKVQMQAFQPDPRLSSIFEMESMLSVPIFLGAEFRGRLYLVNRKTADFSLSDLQYLQLIVSQVAPLLDNFRLLQRMQKVSVLKEKNRIARDLHDGLLQSLASLDLRIEVSRKLLQPTTPEVQKELKELQKIVRDEHDEMRNYMKRLKTPAFAGDELHKVLRDYLRVFENETRLRVSLSLPPQPVPVSRRMGREIYQIIHEALTNVRKHAEAQQVEIELTRLEDTIQLRIRDDGRGFPANSAEPVGSLGTYPWSIQERTRALNGSLQVESDRGRGAQLMIQIPLTS
jgi:signal transduction histidine kinase